MAIALALMAHKISGAEGGQCSWAQIIVWVGLGSFSIFGALGRKGREGWLFVRGLGVSFSWGETLYESRTAFRGSGHRSRPAGFWVGCARFGSISFQDSIKAPLEPTIYMYICVYVYSR